MTELSIPFKVEKGKIPLWVIEKLAQAIAGMDGKYMVLALKERPRSLKQNKFYMGPFIERFQQYLLDCGQRVSHDDIHAGLRDAHAKNSYAILLPGDVAFKVPPSTARLDAPGFEAFLEEIRAEFAERMGWQLPHVGEDL